MKLRLQPGAPRFAECLLASLAALAAFQVRAGDWLQYRGPNHDGVSPETIRTNWPVVPPRQIWKVPLDQALSSFTISGSNVFTQVRRTINGQDTEVCVALSADTGQEVWATPVGTAFYPNGGVGLDDGPRSTPSVDGNQVFVLSSYLNLLCLGINDGHVVWSNNLPTNYNSMVINWQNAASPLIENGLIFLNCNASNQCLLALHETDGAEAWKGQTNSMTQATPIAATIAGVRQIVFFTQPGLISVAPDSGFVYWRYGFLFAVATAASPVASSNAVYCSAAYGVGAGAVQITNSSGQLATNELWRTPFNTMNHWATPVLYNGYLYGIYGQAGLTASIRCIELATGNEMWRQSAQMGGLLLANGVLLIAQEDGTLLLVSPDPTGYHEVARYRALDGSSSSIPGLAVRCWNVPAISNGRIYVRSTTEAVCLDVSTSSAPLKLTLSGGGGAFQLSIGTQDDSPLDTNRAANIDVLASTNLAFDLSGWVKLTNPAVLTNGRLLLDDSQSAVPPQRFFRAREHP
jgi:outer membrane protein assembly factor BamB